MERKTQNLGLFAAGLLVTLLAASAAAIAVPAFGASFAAVDAPAPWLSRMAMKFYPAAFLMPVAMIGFWFAWPENKNRGLACLIAGGCGAFLSVALVVAALYLPIRQLAGTF